MQNLGLLSNYFFFKYSIFLSRIFRFDINLEEKLVLFN